MKIGIFTCFCGEQYNLWYAPDGGLRGGRRENCNLAGSASFALVQIDVCRTGATGDLSKDQRAWPYGGLIIRTTNYLCNFSHMHLCLTLRYTRNRWKFSKEVLNR